MYKNTTIGIRLQIISENIGLKHGVNSENIGLMLVRNSNILVLCKSFFA